MLYKQYQGFFIVETNVTVSFLAFNSCFKVVSIFDVAIKTISQCPLGRMYINQNVSFSEWIRPNIIIEIFDILFLISSLSFFLFEKAIKIVYTEFHMQHFLDQTHV